MSNIIYPRTKIYTGGNITGSGTVSNPLDLNDNIAVDTITASNIIITETASINILNTIEANSLKVGDKYITIMSGANTQAELDGAGILFGSASSGESGEQESVAHIVYRDSGNHVEVYPGLKVSGSAYIVGDITGSSSLIVGQTYAYGLNAVSIGRENTAVADYSFAQGNSNFAYETGSHAEGNGTEAKGIYSHAEGGSTEASGNYSHAEGLSSISFGSFSHAEGSNTQADNLAAHSEGSYTWAFGEYSHAEGASTISIGTGSHSEGFETHATGNYSHAEGGVTYAIGDGSHSEGSNTYAIGETSHAEGFSTHASGTSSHSEGFITKAIGNYSHAEGYDAESIGPWSHAEGNNTVCIETGSHAEGLSTIASASYQHVQGKYNATSSTALMLVGNGTANNNRSNILEVYNNQITILGNLQVSNDITASNISGNLIGPAGGILSGSYPNPSGLKGPVIQISGSTTFTTLNNSENITIAPSGNVNIIPRIGGGINIVSSGSSASPRDVTLKTSAGHIYQGVGSTNITHTSYGYVNLDCGNVDGVALYNGQIRIGADSTNLSKIDIGTSTNANSLPFINIGKERTPIKLNGPEIRTPNLIVPVSSSTILIRTPTVHLAPTSNLTMSAKPAIEYSNFAGNLISSQRNYPNGVRVSLINTADFSICFLNDTSTTPILEGDSTQSSSLKLGASQRVLNKWGILELQYQAASGSNAGYWVETNFSNYLTGCVDLAPYALLSGSVITASSLRTDYIDFNTSSFSNPPPPPAQLGRIFYNGSNGDLSTYLNTSGLMLNNGQQLIQKCQNKSGAPLPKGAVVHLSGSDVSSDTPRINVADWSNDNMSANTLGLTMESIPNDATGYVIIQGVLTGLSLSSLPVAAANGQVLYLSSSGQITNVKPTAPKHNVSIGQLIAKADTANNKTVYVSIQNGYELDELHDVSASVGKQNGDLLVWDSTNGVWKNSKILSGTYNIYGSLLNGDGVSAAGNYSHAEGYRTVANGNYSHAEGYQTLANNDSHAEGVNTTGSGFHSHAEGDSCISSGSYSHAEGVNSIAYANGSHTEGEGTKTYAYASHAEGFETEARGDSSHAEGYQTKSSGSYSHAEGASTEAIGNYSHAEGDNCQSIAWASHAEGDTTISHGYASHTEGEGTIAYGDASHAEGYYTIASASYQHVQGKYNQTSSTALVLIGNGTGSLSSQRSNILEIYTDQMVLSGNLSFPSTYGINFGNMSGSGASSTILNDYEEGTWTPAFSGSTVGGSYDYMEQSGRYTKIGSLVNVSGFIRITTINTYPTGNLLISGLPYSVKNESGSIFSGVASTYGNMSGGSDVIYIIQGLQNNTYLSIKRAFNSNVTGSDLSNNAFIGFSVSYRAN